MSEQKIPIPAMLYNAAVGGHVTNSQQIIDENLNREQNDINQETVGAVPYNSTTPNGMGRIVLKKNDNFKQVVEAQTDGNTIFVIKYDFTLTGNVTIPANCVLEFDGGSIDGGGTAGSGNGHTITFNNTVVTKQKNAFTNCRFGGSLATQQVFVSTFGVVADGVTDDGYVLQDIIDCAYGKSSEVIFDCDGDYGIGTYGNEVSGHHMDLAFKTNTVYTFTGKGFIKLLCYSASGTVCVCESTENVVINNIKIDGNFLRSTGLGSGNNGLSISKNKNLRINGGVIKNTARGEVILDTNTNHLVGYDGGKGIQTELYGNENCLIHGVSFFDCFMAISAHTTYNSNYIPQIINFSDIYAENCDIFMFACLVNATDLDASLLSISLNNFIVKDCGFHCYGIAGAHNPQDYTGEDPDNNGDYVNESGVFVFSRATNLHITNGQVIGTKKAYKIFAGTTRYCSIENVIVKQECDVIISRDATFYGRDTNQSLNNLFNVDADCVHGYYVASTLGSHSNFGGCTFKVKFFKNPTTGFSLGSYVSNDSSNTVDIYARKDQYTVYHFEGDFGYLQMNPVHNKVYNIDKLTSSTSQNDIPQYKAIGYQWTYINSDSIPRLLLYSSHPNKFVEYDGEDAFISRQGTTGIREAYVYPRKPGFMYFDTDLLRPVFLMIYNDSEHTRRWFTADGVVANTPRHGLYADRPDSWRIPIGFSYFATDKGTAGVGAPIYYTGDSTTPWVYADGTAVS